MEFNQLLAGIALLIKSPLKADANQCCLIDYAEENIQIQLELEQGTENLLIGANIGKVPPGRYRQDLFEQALKANFLDVPKGGFLAYSPKAEQLVLFFKVPSQNLSPDQALSIINGFKDKYKRWKEGLDNNQIPQLVGYIPTKGTSSGMFGLR